MRMCVPPPCVRTYVHAHPSHVVARGSGGTAVGAEREEGCVSVARAGNGASAARVVARAGEGERGGASAARVGNGTLGVRVREG